MSKDKKAHLIPLSALSAQIFQCLWKTSTNTKLKQNLSEASTKLEYNLSITRAKGDGFMQKLNKSYALQVGSDYQENSGIDLFVP